MNPDSAPKPDQNRQSGDGLCMVCDSAPAANFYDRDFLHICRDCAWHSSKALAALLNTPGIECPTPVSRPIQPRRSKPQQ